MTVWIINLTNNDDDPDYEIVKTIGVATSPRAIENGIRNYVRINRDKIFRNPDFLVPETDRAIKNGRELEWTWYDPASSERYTFYTEEQPLITLNNKGKH
jgi:hypothetical protein